MLFVLSKEIRAAKGDKREERERVTHVVWGGQAFFSSRKHKDPVQAKQITVGLIQIFQISQETIL